MEAPAKQDHFWYCSASKTVNAKTFTATARPLLLQMERSQSMNADHWAADCKLTRPFHFWLDESAELYNFSHSALNLPASIRCNEAYSFFVVVAFWGGAGLGGGGRVSPNTNRIICIIIHFKQRNHWKTDKTIKPPAELLSDRRERSTTLWWQIFCGTDMKRTMTLEGLAAQRDLRFADRVVPRWRLDWSGEQKIYF